MSNISMNMATQQMMNRGYLFNIDYAINNKYEFWVTMKDGTEKKIESKIYADTAKHSNYLLITDKKFKKGDPMREQRIYSDQTSRILRQTSDWTDTVVTIKGIATDSCWLFKVVQGKINAYSYLSETENLSTFYISAFQEGNGPVQKLTPEALEPIIKTDEKAYAAFKKKDYLSAIKKYNKSHPVNK
jgi:hypothetical protein